MEQGVRAMSEDQTATCHLQDNLSASIELCQRYVITDGLTWSPR
jgi:hypothetical protein